MQPDRSLIKKKNQRPEMVIRTLADLNRVFPKNESVVFVGNMSDLQALPKADLSGAVVADESCYIK